MSTAANPRSSDAVPSPCISVCTLDAAGTVCLGCYRTCDEIALWSVLDADARRVVLAALPARRAARSKPARDAGT
jgi:hypothetical protein